MRKVPKNNTFHTMNRRAILWVLSGCFIFSAFGGVSPWRRLARGNVILYCHENDLKNGERVLLTVAECSPKILEDLDLAEPDSLTLFLAGSRDEFSQMTDHQMPEWSAGAADARRSVLYLQSPRFADPDTKMETVVAHELGHAILGMAVRGAPVPRWFEEGFAMLESGESAWIGTVQLMRGFLFSGALDLSEIEDVLRFNRDRAALAYQESLAAVKYLVERFGPESIPDLVSVLRQGGTMAEAVRRVTGHPYRQFQAEWFESMKRKYRMALVLDSSLLLSLVFVMLFAAAWVSTKIRTERKKMEWEKYTEQDREDHEAHSSPD